MKKLILKIGMLCFMSFSVILCGCTKIPKIKIDWDSVGPRNSDIFFEGLYFNIIDSESVEVAGFRPSESNTEIKIPKEVKGYTVKKVQGKYFAISKALESITWLGGYPVGWEKLKFKSSFINVFMSEEKPEWLGSAEHYLPGKIACPEEFRENYSECDLYLPERSVTVHYNYENSENSDIYFYCPFLNENDFLLFSSLNPQRTGYQLEGFFEDPQCTKKIHLGVLFEGELIIEKKQLHIYAGWIKEELSNEE